jgi:multidrug efflux pump subunit AcrA (membrane-fusion protein)
MALSLRDLHGNAAAEAGRAQATVADLERELELRRAQAEQAARDAEAAAKRAEAERRQAEKTGRVRLAELEREISQAVATAPDRPAPALRGLAREWLHGAGEEGLQLERFERLQERDPAAGRLRALSVQAGQLMALLQGTAGLPADHELCGRADELECWAWQGLVGRIRVIAGED